MILALAFGALHAWGISGLVPIYTFLRHSSKAPDFHDENMATCHLTFAAEIRHQSMAQNIDAGK